MRGLMYLAVSLFIVAALHAAEADALREKGIAALKESQTKPRALTEAAKICAQAAQSYAVTGQEALAAEMYAYVFWCKKKMPRIDIDAIVKSGDKAVIDAFAEVDKNIDVQKARACLDSAEAFAEAWPAEHFLCAIRFFEVAERFKETLPGLTAHERFTSEKANADEESSPKKAAPQPKDANIIPVEAVAIMEQQDKRVAVPPAISVTEADKHLRALLKDDFAKRKPDERSALAKKLLDTSAEGGHDMPTKYAALILSRDLAAEAGDAVTAMFAVDRLAELFVVVAAMERNVAFKRLLEGQRPLDSYRHTAEAVMKAFDEAVASDQFAALRQQVAFGELAVAKAEHPSLTSRMKAKLLLVEEILREWPACKVALDVFKADRSNAAANLTFGRFYAFMKGDFDRGVRALARSAQEPWKKLGETEQSNPFESAAQLALADAWWEVGEKEKSKQAQLSMFSRANLWYSKALPTLKGDEKARADKRVARLADMMQIYAPPLYDMPGRWSVKWAKHPERGQKSVEFLADGTIKCTASDFGDYVPDRWAFKDRRIMFHFKSNMICGMEIVDENTLKQESAFGEAVFTRKK